MKNENLTQTIRKDKDCKQMLIVIAECNAKRSKEIAG